MDGTTVGIIIGVVVIVIAVIIIYRHETKPVKCYRCERTFKINQTKTDVKLTSFPDNWVCPSCKYRNPDQNKQ